MSISSDRVGADLSALSESAAAWKPGDLVLVAEFENDMKSVLSRPEIRGLPPEARAEAEGLVASSRALLE
jgi:hypothetical protein